MWTGHIFGQFAHLTHLIPQRVTRVHGSKTFSDRGVMRFGNYVVQVDCKNLMKANYSGSIFCTMLNTAKNFAILEILFS